MHVYILTEQGCMEKFTVILCSGMHCNDKSAALTLVKFINSNTEI